MTEARIGDLVLRLEPSRYASDDMLFVDVVVWSGVRRVTSTFVSNHDSPVIEAALEQMNELQKEGKHG